MREKTKCTRWFRYTIEDAKAALEPARWKSWSEKDENSRADYLALCGEAGWELISEDGGLFYFRAREGTDPAPIQTDAGVEWEGVWKKALRGQLSSMLYVVIYGFVWSGARFLQDRPRVWELFLSNAALAAQGLLLLLLALELFLAARVLRYRIKCRRAAAEGESFPVPRRAAARLRGASSWIFWVVGAGGLF